MRKIDFTGGRLDAAAESGLTCDRCLGFGKAMDHRLCQRPWTGDGGCVCNVCAPGRRRVDTSRPKPRPPRPVRRRQEVAVPASAAVKRGRMTAEQVELIPRLRAAGWSLKEIGAALGGWHHTAIMLRLRSPS